MKYPIIILFLVVLVTRQSESAEGRDIAREVKKIISDEVGWEIDKIMLSYTIRGDLGADDLAVVEITYALEETFELDIPDEDANKLLTVNDIIEYVSRKSRE